MLLAKQKIPVKSQKNQTYILEIEVFLRLRTNCRVNNINYNKL